MALQRRKILAQALNLGHGTDTIPADSGGDLLGDKIGIHTFSGEAVVSLIDFEGDDASNQLASAIDALPSDGGTVDMRGEQGGQVISSDVFSGVTKDVRLRFGNGTFVSSVSLTVPSNITLDFSEGGILSIASGKTLTVNGPILAPPVQIFAGSGSFAIGRSKATRVLEVYPQWWGAEGNGQRVQDAVMASADATLTSATAVFSAEDVGKPIVVEGAGASSATLITTIASVTNANTVELTDTASTTVSAVQAIWATNDTTAIQAAIDAHHRVRFIDGIYGLTRMRLHPRSVLRGSGMDATMLSRMGIGSGGEAIGMTTGEVAQSLNLTDFTLMCNQVGSALNGISFAQGNAYAYANDSWMDNIRVMAVGGIGIDLNVNVGSIGQVWIQNFPGQGTPDALSITSSAGFKSANTMLLAKTISVEGHFEAGEVLLNAAASRIDTIQLEPTGVYATKDSITFGAAFQYLGNVLAIQWNGTACTRRDLVRITAGIQAITIGELVNSSAFPITYTNLVHDLNTSTTLAYDASGRATVSNYHNDQQDTVVYDDVLKVRMGKRFALKRGTDVVGSSTTLTLPYNGNFFGVSGTGNINAIDVTDWPDGAQVALLFTGVRTIKHNTAGAAGSAKIMLAGGQDILTVASATMLTLRYDSGSAVWWQEAPTARRLATYASDTDSAGFILPHGNAPTSPANGEVWTTTAGMFVRINGVTKSVNLT